MLLREQIIYISKYTVVQEIKQIIKNLIMLYFVVI
jgi:hypothetical protein